MLIPMEPLALFEKKFNYIISWTLYQGAKPIILLGLPEVMQEQYCLLKLWNIELTTTYVQQAFLWTLLDMSAM